MLSRRHLVDASVPGGAVWAGAVEAKYTRKSENYVACIARSPLGASRARMPAVLHACSWTQIKLLAPDGSAKP